MFDTNKNKSPEMDNQQNIKKSSKKTKPPSKRKKGCGCGGCIAGLLIFVLIFTGGIVGGVFWAWGEYVEPELDMSLVEFSKVLSDLYKIDESTIVTKPYSDNDLQEFYTQFKETLFLSQDTQIEISDLINGFMPAEYSDPTQLQSYKTTNGYNPDDIPEGLDPNDLPEGIDPNDIPSGTISTGNPNLDKLLEQLNFDFSILVNYDGNPYILEVTDKQLAAFIAESMKEASKIPALNEKTQELKNTYGIDLMEVLSIKQVIIDSKDIANQTNTRLSVTISFDLRTSLTSILQKYKVPKVVANILPKSIYATMSFYPNNSALASEISVNSVGSASVDKLLLGVDKLITRYSQQESAIGNILNTINAQFVGIIEQAQSVCPLNFVDSGSIELRPIEAMLNTMNLSITEGQFLALIRDVSLPNAKSLDLDGYTQSLRDENVGYFITNLTQNYGIVQSQDNPLTPDNIFVQLTQMVQNNEIANNVNLKELCDYSLSYDSDLAKELMVKANYQGFAGLLNNSIKNSNQNNSTSGVENVRTMSVVETPSTTSVDFDATILNVKYYDSQRSANIFSNPADVLQFTVELELAKLLGIDKSTTMGQLLSKIIPTSIFIDLYVDITKSDQEGFVPQATYIRMNQKSQQATTEHLETIKALANSFGANTSQLDLDNIASSLDTQVRDNLNQLSSTLGKDLEFDENYIWLPNIFEILAGMDKLKPTENSPKEFLPKELYEIFAEVFNYTNTNNNVTEDTNVNSLITELENKYYLKTVNENNGEPVFDTSSSKSFTKQFNDINNNFHENISTKRLYSDTTQDIDHNLKPIITESELGYIVDGNLNFSESVFIESEVFKNAKVIGCRIVDQKIDVALVANISFGMNSQPIFINLTIYIQNIYDYSGVDGDKTITQFLDMTINNINDTAQDNDGNTQYDNFLLFAQRMSGAKIDKNEIFNRIQSDILISFARMKANNIQIKLFDSQEYPDYKYAFIDNTIFDIALKELYKTPKENEVVPTSQEFREILQIANNQNEDALNSMYNIADNSYGIAKKFNDSYFLTEAYKFNENSDEPDSDILHGLTNLSRDYYQAIDGQRLATTNEDMEELRTKLSEAEFAKLLSVQEMTFSSSLKETQLLYVRILSSQIMIIGYKAKINKESVANPLANGENNQNSWNTVFVPEIIHLEIQVDLTKLKDTQETCAKIIINSMNDQNQEGKDDLPYKGNQMSLFVSIISKFTNQEFDKNQSDINTSQSIRDNMSNVNMTYTIGKITVDNVFEIVVSNIKKTTPTTNLTAEELRATMQALFDNIPEYGTNKSVFSDDQSDPNNIIFSGSQVIMKERYLGAIMQNNITNFANVSLGQNANMTIEKFGLMSESDYSIGDYALDINSTYIATTFSVSTQQLLGQNTTLLPQNIIFTYFLNSQDHSDYKVIFATMTVSQVAILQELLQATTIKDSSPENGDNPPSSQQNMLNSLFDGGLADKLTEEILKINVSMDTDYGTISRSMQDLLSSGQIEPDATTQTGQIVIPLII